MFLSPFSALTDAKCTIDLEGDVPAELLSKIEDDCNRLIVEALPVTIAYDSTQIIEGDVARSICIERLPPNLCCGTHVSNIAQLRCIKIIDRERVRGRNTRVHFVAGDRALAYFATLDARSKQLASVLKCGPGQHVDIVTKQLDAARAAQKANLSLSRTIGRLVWRSVESALSATPAASAAVFVRCDDADKTFGMSIISLVKTNVAQLKAAPSALLVVVVVEDAFQMCEISGDASAALLQCVVAAKEAILGAEAKGTAKGNTFQGRCLGAASFNVAALQSALPSNCLFLDAIPQ